MALVTNRLMDCIALIINGISSDAIKKTHNPPELVRNKNTTNIMGARVVGRLAPRPPQYPRTLLVSLRLPCQSVILWESYEKAN